MKVKFAKVSFALGFSLKKKFDFFYEARQTFGRSALLLSGGSTLGMYHLGGFSYFVQNNNISN